ncbi:hypothetical protein OROHE_017414 [Orobanche hederae]
MGVPAVAILQRLDSARALKFPNPENENAHVKQYVNVAKGLTEREDNVSLKLTEEILQSMEVGLAFRDYNGRISSLDYHKAVSYVVTASDDESIHLYDVSTATMGWDESLRLLSLNDNKYLRYFRGHHDSFLLWDQRAEKCQGLLRVRGRPATAYDEQWKRSGPFNIFSVGGDMSDANVVRFSNNGRLVLLTTTDGHIHVLDSFRGTLSSRCPESPNRAAAQNS